MWSNRLQAIRMEAESVIDEQILMTIKANKHGSLPSNKNGISDSEIKMPNPSASVLLTHLLKLRASQKNALSSCKARVQLTSGKLIPILFIAKLSIARKVRKHNHQPEKSKIPIANKPGYQLVSVTSPHCINNVSFLVTGHSGF